MPSWPEELKAAVRAKAATIPSPERCLNCAGTGEAGGIYGIRCDYCGGTGRMARRERATLLPGGLRYNAAC